MVDKKRLVSNAPCAVILLAAAVLQFKACTMDLPRLLDHLTVDDTFLYLQIAKNVAAGNGPTFDGIHATNGFQPLWLAATVPLGVLFEEPERFFRACLFLCALCNMLTIWLLYKVGLRLGGRSVALPLIIGFLWVLTRWKPFLSGMETSLYLLIFAGFLYLLLGANPSKWRLSTLSGLLLLCRVDAVVYIMGGFLASKRPHRKAVLGWILPAVLITAPYFVWNQVSFGSLLPVSGRVKALYHKQELGDQYLQKGHLAKTFSLYLPRTVRNTARDLTAPAETAFRRKFATEAVWGCLLALVALLLAKRGRKQLLILAVSGVLHLIIISASIGRFSPMAWYYAPLILLVTVGASVGLSTICRALHRRLLPLATVLLCGILGFTFWTGWISLDVDPEPEDLYQRRYRLARWMKLHLPADAIIGSWNAGQLAYFSNLSVINLDGLVNDQHYLQRIKARRPVLEYVEEECIDYIVDYNARDLSMPPDKKWNPKRWFRGDLPKGRLKTLRLEPPGGRKPNTVYIFRIIPPKRSQGGRERASSRTVQTGKGELNSGRWRKYRTHRFDTQLSENQQRLVRRLESIGYLSGSAEAPASESVIFHARGAAYQGLNFYTSGHGPEAVLMDMDGRVLHTWKYAFRDVWPDYPVSENHHDRHFWRRAHLFENGDILAIYGGLGIIKLDKDSNLIWENPCRAHHEIDVLPNGDIYVLTREARFVPRVSTQSPILEDFVSILDPEGNEKAQVSLLECFENSDRYREMWLRRKEQDVTLRRVNSKGNGDIVAGDIFHTNTLHVLGDPVVDQTPTFRSGNVLISILQMDAIAVVDLERVEVMWAYQGDFKKQHDPRILGNGNLLLFDNRGESKRSRVIEYDLATMEKRWVYRGTEKRPFYSETCGTSQRLPNGNTLITETDGGRALEVTPDKTTVWEFYNPHRAGKQQEFIATLFEVIRLEPDFPTDWARTRREK